MSTETNQVREKYDVTLQRRASELCESLGITDVKQIALVHTTLSETAKESWKNGLQAGRMRARKPQAAEAPKTA